MKKCSTALILLPLLLIILTAEQLAAQGWIKRKNAPNNLEFAAASAVSGKGFLTGGSGTALYQYDPATFAWTYKTPMPGYARFSSVTVTVNGKLYSGLGICNFWQSASAHICHREFYEYDPATDSWTQKASFPGSARWLMGSFVANNKIYITLGQGLTSPLYPTDMWEYDPATDTWTQKANYPGTGKDAVISFSINNKGYITGGGNGLLPQSAALWEYNPVTDTWTQKASNPGIDYGGTGFSLGGYGYILTSNNDFARYDPAADSWTVLPAFPGLSRQVGTSFSAGGSGFITTGNHPTATSWTILNDLWEYNPNCPANIINDLNIDNHQALYCTDTLLIDSVKAYDVTHPGVAYTWLASTDGITYTPATGGNNAVLENRVLTQTTYFKRVAYLNNQCFDTSAALQVNISPYQYPDIDTLTPATICQGDTVLLQCINDYPTRWYLDGVPLADTNDIYKATQTGEYSVWVTNHAGCEFFSDTIKVTVHPNPVPAPYIVSDSIVSNMPAVAYQWYLDNTAISAAIDSFIVPLATGAYKLQVTDSNGCTGMSAPLHFQPAGIGTVATGSRWQIYPNPATARVTISYPATGNLYITNVQGIRIQHIYFNQKATIDMSAWPAGLYFLALHGDNGTIARKRVIKE